MHAAHHAYLTKLRNQGRQYQGMPVPEELPDVDEREEGYVSVATIVREVLTELEAARELQELEEMAAEQRDLRPKGGKKDA